MSKYKSTIFNGAATALITPFKDGEIDYSAIEDLIEYQISNKIDALVVAGTTGEASALSFDEQISLIKFVAEKVDKRVPLLAGTGNNNIDKACALTKEASAVGVDGLLVVTPYYNKATQRGLCEYYKKIASNTKKPIILYNVPTRTGVNISLDTYRELSKVDNIVGVKEAAYDMISAAELISECGEYLDVYSGNDDLILPIMSIGGIGVISVLSNLLPNEIHSICYNYLGGNHTEARKLFQKYLKLMKAMFCEVNPIPIKLALSEVGLISEEYRLPMCEISPRNREMLISMLSDFELIQPKKG